MVEEMLFPQAVMGENLSTIGRGERRGLKRGRAAILVWTASTLNLTYVWLSLPHRA
jgi:hypothetical protein